MQTTTLPSDLKEEVDELLDNGYRIAAISGNKVFLYKCCHPPLFTIAVPLALAIKFPIPFAAYFLTSLGFFVWGNRYCIALEPEKNTTHKSPEAP